MTNNMSIQFIIVAPFALSDILTNVAVLYLIRFSENGCYIKSTIIYVVEKVKFMVRNF